MAHNPTRPLLNSEIQRFKKHQAMFLGKKKTEKIEPIDIKDYAK